MSTASAPIVGPLVPTDKRGYSTAWWGMATLIATAELRYSVPFSFVLWGSSIPIFWADAAIKKGRQGALRAGLLLSALMGASFLLYTARDFNDLTFGWRTNAYGSIYYTIVGLHALHVIIGLGFNVIVQVKAWQRKFTAERHTTVEVFSLYWHFVDAVWIFVFSSLFLSEALR